MMSFRLVCLVLASSMVTTLDIRLSRKNRKECRAMPAVDCFTKGFMVNPDKCSAIGCKWCPKPPRSKDPWCVTGQKRPRQCSSKGLIDCFERGSMVTKPMCDKKNCHWCPNPNGPWCVKEPDETGGKKGPINPGCSLGFSKRYNDSESCCKLPIPSSCGIIQPKKRILGGHLSSKGAWPWLVHFSPFKDAVCAAVFIGKNRVITAGHCVYKFPLRDMVFSFGIMNWKRPSRHSKSYKPKKIVLHTHFESYPRLLQDIALVELEKPNAASKSIDSTPICLPQGEDPALGSKCFIAGWGSTKFGGHSSPDLREAQVYIIENSVCRKAYGSSYDSKHMICAGHLDGKADSCLGDSGGPLMCQRSMSCQWYVAGLVSYGMGCGRPGYPGVYTRVSAFEEWLKKNVKSEKKTSKNNKNNEFNNSWK